MPWRKSTRSASDNAEALCQPGERKANGDCRNAIVTTRHKRVGDQGESSIACSLHGRLWTTGDYWIFIAEREAMKQDVTMDAAAMAKDLGASGSVALYGIYFDTGTEA